MTAKFMTIDSKWPKAFALGWGRIEHILSVSLSKDLSALAAPKFKNFYLSHLLVNALVKSTV